jgi:hypothetical protein
MPISQINQNSLATPVAGNGPAFSAYGSGTAQSVTSGVSTKVQLNTEEFDTANAFKWEHPTLAKSTQKQLEGIK